MILLALLFIDSIKKFDPKPVTYSAIEINHRYDDMDRHCYDQVLLWDWNAEYRRYDVQAWFLLSNNTLHERPRKVGDYYIIDLTRDGKSYKIKSKIFRETWTDTDPERDNKNLMDEKFRRGLKK